MSFPAKARIQCFQILLDACLRGHVGISDFLRVRQVLTQKDHLIATVIADRSTKPLYPCLFKLIISIQIAVLNGFRDVIDLEIWLCLQIGDGAGNF